MAKLLRIAVVLVALGCSHKQGPRPVPAPTWKSSGAFKAGDRIDCTRIEDPAYREEVRKAGTDPDSIDCGEAE
jgi:hypothetical protein